MIWKFRKGHDRCCSHISQPPQLCSCDSEFLGHFVIVIFDPRLAKRHCGFKLPTPIVSACVINSQLWPQHSLIPTWILWFILNPQPKNTTQKFKLSLLSMCGHRSWIYNYMDSHRFQRFLRQLSDCSHRPKRDHATYSCQWQALEAPRRLPRPDSWRIDTNRSWRHRGKKKGSKQNMFP